MNLSELLQDAVADVDPADRLDEIRSRTAGRTHSAARPWLYAAGATVLATAATVAAFAVVGSDGGHRGEHATNRPSETLLVAAYFVGDTPEGPRLYREFDEVTGSDALQAALDRIQQPSADPDYRTPWKPGSFESATLGDDRIDVEVGSGISGARALALQQVVYTLDGALGRTLPVRFLQDGEPITTVAAATQIEVLSPMSISDPVEGEAYEGSFIARGRASSFEATVGWQVRDGDTVVADGSTMASSGAGDRLYPWEVEIDVSDLAPGTYTFVAMTDDPTVEPPGPTTDTRTIVVR